MKHIHADLMKQYAEDAQETNHPFKRWEKLHKFDHKWYTLETHPNWGRESQYRHKPKTIAINGFVVPEPIREPLAESKYYFSIDFIKSKGFYRTEWANSELDYRMLNSGLVHLVEKNAELHARALLSFTEKKS